MAKRVIDTWSGELYPGLKVAYDTLLAAGELDAVDECGYLKLRHAFPGRFVTEGEEDWGAYYGFLQTAEEALKKQDEILLGHKEKKKDAR
jgi:hypothetical protein